MERSLPKVCQCLSAGETFSFGIKHKHETYQSKLERRVNKNVRTILERKETAERNSLLAKISAEGIHERDKELPKDFGICQILAKKLDIENEEENKTWDSLVPECSYTWTKEDVAKWMKELGFPQYQRAMKVNFITGRKLIYLDANSLSKMGIKNFEHIKIITASVRELLKIKPEVYSRSIALPPREPMALYLQQKWYTGEKNDSLTYHKFLRDHGLHPNDP